ncbi:MAG: glutathione transferase GstA [Burkholderiaceae bacterium]|nr:glutathione transferase GstA [Burkholderiaceae bacterium]
MKLYFSPGACSLSPHIVLREAGLAFTPVKVNLKEHQIDGGGDFYAVNPKGYVPVLELDDGTLLTEGPAIVQYVADQAPATQLAPASGTVARYKLQEWLNFISTEIHKQYSPLFNQDTPDEVKTKQRDKIASRYDWISKQLGDNDYLTGSTFTVADAYLFTVTNWARSTGIDMTRWPVLQAFMKRVAARPHVQEALKAEGLVK